MFVAEPCAKPSSGEDRERRQQPERHHVLEDAARPDAAVVDDRDERGQREADGEPRRVDRAAADRVEADTSSAPGTRAPADCRSRPPPHGQTIAYDRIIVQPAPKLTSGGNTPFGVGDLRAGILNPLHEAAVGVRDRNRAAGRRCRYPSMPPPGLPRASQSSIRTTQPTPIIVPNPNVKLLDRAEAAVERGLRRRPRGGHGSGLYVIRRYNPAV